MFACATYRTEADEEFDASAFPPPQSNDASSPARDSGTTSNLDAAVAVDGNTPVDAGAPLPPWSTFTGAMTSDGAWLWSGISRTWTSTAAPTELMTRGNMCSAVDREGRILYFGGHNSGAGATSTADLFRFDGTRWDVLRASAGFPLGRTGAGCFVHPTTGEFFVFGGIRYAGASPPLYLTDSWKWDGTGTSWVQLTASPWGNSVAPGYAFDTKRSVLVMRGGGASTGRHRESYDWNGTNWTLWASSNSDDYTSALAIAYHGKREQVVRLGGLNPGNAITDACQVSNPTFSGWIACNGTIAARYNHAMAYDPADQKVVVFGGVNAAGVATQDTWTWDGTWTNGSGGTSPPAKTVSSFNYLASLQKLVLVGGF